jgi:glutathione S-transferase
MPASIRLIFALIRYRPGFVTGPGPNFTCHTMPVFSIGGKFSSQLLRDDEVALYEATAILRYIDECFDGAPILAYVEDRPEGVKLMANARRACYALAQVLPKRSRNCIRT